MRVVLYISDYVRKISREETQFSGRVWVVAGRTDEWEAFVLLDMLDTHLIHPRIFL